jgi:hypothetical protein
MLATPCVFVLAGFVPLNVALAPDVGAVNVTLADGTGLL